MTKKTAYVGLGSNLGTRALAIDEAVKNLGSLEDTTVSDVSNLYETSPIGVKGEAFFNAVAVIKTGLSPQALLQALLGIETAMGRTRKPGSETVSRIIDLDLLLYEDIEIRDEDLVLPHPRMLKRRFVMEPLAELAPGRKIPPASITAAEAAAALVKSHPEQKAKRLGTLEEEIERLRV